MTEEAKEARRAYKRQWAKDHPGSVKASQEKYWEKRAQQAAQLSSQGEGEDAGVRKEAE